jgi:hypothetical protein
VKSLAKRVRCPTCYRVMKAKSTDWHPKWKFDADVVRDVMEQVGISYQLEDKEN